MDHAAVAHALGLPVLDLVSLAAGMLSSVHTHSAPQPARVSFSP